VRARVLCAAAAGLVGVAGPALAHHGGSAYDMTRLVTIEGTVVELAWKNPHIALTVETDGSDGAPILQEIEVMSVSQARGLGLSREAIGPGAHVVVRAAPGRGGPGARAFGVTVTMGGGAVMPLSSFARLSAAPQATVEATGLSGRWAPTVESFASVVAAGRSAALTEAGRAAREAALDRYAAPGGVGICTPLSPPLLHVFPDLRTIEVGEATVVIRTETNGVAQERVVHLDQDAHPPGFAPTAEGHSTGSWEGDTLVIDTIGFAPSPTPDLLLLPTRPDAHLVERLTLTEDRRRIDYAFTIEVPDYLAAPASFRATWSHRPELEPSEAECDPETARRFLEEE
jgi:hypothetical protein